jgi:lipoprotein-anchoring transpeptidase ErfK/SrfK
MPITPPMNRVSAPLRIAAFVLLAGTLAFLPACTAVTSDNKPGADTQWISNGQSVAGLSVVLPDPVRNGPLPALEAIPAVPPALLVEVRQGLAIRSKPGGGSVVGFMPAASAQFGFRTYAWVIETSRHGRFGRVPIPYSRRTGTGWIPLKGLRRLHTAITVRADLSEHRITVERLGRVVFRTSAATGAPGTPTPPGRYFVTDRVPFARGSRYGSFAFGISNYQYRLPAGWQGGSQLAIHGTNAPSSIGHSVSTGCLRVSERALALLKPLLRLGTPVIIQR